MRYVLEFSKKGLIAFTSHLDLMRIFKRSFRRAGFDVEYSHGFNPHPKISFAQPLSLGYEGERELLEFSSGSELNKEDTDRLILPEGIKVLGLGVIREEKRSIAASVYAADYTISIPGAFDKKDLDLFMEKLSGKEPLIVEKKTKKGGLKELDIKPMISDFELIPGEDGIKIKTKLDSGSSSNLSPELIIEAFSREMPESVERSTVSVVRERLYIPVDYKIEML